MRFLLFFLVFIFHFLISAGVVDAQIKVIKADYHFDSEAGKFGGPIELLVNGGKIIELGQKLDYNANEVEVIDLGNATLLPGLIDAHTHLFIEENLHPNYKGFGEAVVKDAHLTDAERTLQAAFRAKTYLDQGFTTIVDLGNSGEYMDVDLRNAINRGLVVGPRVLAAGKGIAAIGGQLNYYYEEADGLIDREYDVVTGTQEAIQAVREHVLRRVDLIKLYADNAPNMTSLSVDELRVIVEEAKRHDLWVTAHAITKDAALKAAEAGVESIEHAYNVDDATIELLKKNGQRVVPTYSDTTLAHQMFRNFGVYDDERRSKIIARSNKRQQENLLKLYDSGLEIVFGSDMYSGVNMTRGQASKHCLYAYVEAGIPLPIALQYATYNAGKHIQQKDKVGVLKKDATADIIAVRGNLQQDHRLLDDCIFIMQRGEVYQNEMNDER